ncbi:MAG: YeiH family protein [Phycisphaerales bacterium]
MRRAVFIIAVLFCLSPTASAPIALALGLILALLNLTAWEPLAKRSSRLLIQVSIVLLGFSIDLHEVVRAGATGMLFAAGTIAGSFALGALVGRWLKIDAKLTTLLSSGTAICGGSAIAATGAVIRASDAQMSVALAAVFLLNAVALYLFPPIGHALSLSQTQFGAWAAIGIHDMSSVVGAGRMYGDEALATATVIKLARVLWIVPVGLLAGWIVRRAERRAATAGTTDPAQPASPAAPRSLPAMLGALVPWFIVLFLAASLARTALPSIAAARFDLSWGDQGVASPADLLKTIAKQLMVLALFLIGSGLSRKALAEVGWRPFALGIILWVSLSTAALALVRATIS